MLVLDNYHGNTIFLQLYSQKCHIKHMVIIQFHAYIKIPWYYHLMHHCNMVHPLCFSVKVVCVWFLCHWTWCVWGCDHRLWLTVLNIGQTPVESCGAWQWLDIANPLSLRLLFWQTCCDDSSGDDLLLYLKPS